MRKKEIASTDYDTLLSNISTIYEHARQTMVKAYWEIGREIVLVEQKGKSRAARNTGVMARLSADMTRDFGKGFSVDNLERMRRFYLEYPKSATSRIITWSQYVELLGVRDKRVRTELENLIETKDIPVRLLRQKIRNEYQLPLNYKSSHKALLPSTRGTLYTYRIKEIALKRGQKRLAVDCGFSTYNDQIVLSYSDLKAGDIVESKKFRNGFKLVKRTDADAQKGIFTYKAYVERVVDGDTIWVYIPCGFGFAFRQKLRLKGIDSPELGTKEGERAKQFVERRLSKVSFVVIKTYSRDKYDRYLVDVFYLFGAQDADHVSREGRFLNQEIVDAGLG